MRVRRRDDQKLLVMVALGGLLLIAAPIVVFSQTVEPLVRAGDPMGFRVPVVGGDPDEPFPTSQPLRDSPLVTSSPGVQMTLPRS
ncbi:hypothetical protein AB0L88_18655 [Saccharopolyspora shandongensis]|uniref:hypothetical protein n=1 Tax=Saccharopolyspora shandongensis TaxID=418495 RepID=UPI0034320F2A